MASLNRVFFIGNLTRDPELRYIPSGTPVVSFGLAINTSYSSASGGVKEEVCFVRVVAWGKQAEACNQYLKKGRSVFVEGRLVYRSWEQEGAKRSTLEVRADRVQFLGPRREEASPGGASPVDEPAPSDVGTAPDTGGDDEPPF